MQMKAEALRVAGWGGAAALLLLAGIGSVLIPGMDWGAGDFVAAALLFGLTGLALEGVGRLPAPMRVRLMMAAGVLAALALLWAELAVGLF